MGKVSSKCERISSKWKGFWQWELISSKWEMISSKCERIYSKWERFPANVKGFPANGKDSGNGN